MEKDTVKLVRLSHLTLRKPVDNDEASLTWAVRMGFPRITVYTSSKITGEDGKVDYGKVITAPFDYVNFKLFIDYLKELVDGESDNKYILECFNVKFVNNVRTDDVRIQARVTIGKDKNGILYIAAVEDDKVKIRFDFLPNNKWYKYYDKDGKEIKDNAKLSKLYTKNYICLLETAIMKEFTIDVKDEVQLPPPPSHQPTVSKEEPKKDSSSSNIEVSDGLDELEKLLA